ncbi:MAG: radical SAM protein [Methanobrevibacter sp.]|uniref:radical SAM protein n=1 Tax=Methanobrevibacter sp. TaxID=66852 RepID=UPI0025D8B0A4|nr:radical SAM protein [Methanobrevibacter sp.]MBR0271726.1 radical SAM protein [Methanobrevibacter sp.]
MEKEFDIQEYLANGAENIIKNAISATLKNPKETLFLAKFMKHSRKASKIRKQYGKNDINIPAFLIASITSRCNLHCAGCYSRANDNCSDDAAYNQLSDDDWEDIFKQSRDLGINFIVLAGGEPLIRKDVILKACEYPEILFPVFTNGTMLDEYYDLIDEKRNIIPIVSIEGDETLTDSRRGAGVYNQLIESMNYMNDNNLIFGASITITNENISYALSDEFITKLYDLGCKVLFFIEYVPVDINAQDLALTDNQRDYLLDEIIDLRKRYEEMLFMSFPGDEKESGGCLAAGRGFFHINSHGGAEPCPASPYSDINVKETSVLEALESDLFRTLRSSELLMSHHEGGCVLFEHEKEVQKLLNKE